VGTWQEQVVQEMTEMVSRVVADTNAMWESGVVAADSSVAWVAQEFSGVQYAPWYSGGAWHAPDKAAWDAGNAQAAAYYKGKGVSWTVDQLTVLPRSPEEAAVMYRISHWTPGQEQPVQALFLETWIKQEGQWNLLRHTAEKSRG
jgi:hypothetical protein